MNSNDIYIYIYIMAGCDSVKLVACRLYLSIPFCTLAVLVCWLLLLVVYRFDLSESEAMEFPRNSDGNFGVRHVPSGYLT